MGAVRPDGVVRRGLAEALQGTVTLSLSNKGLGRRRRGE